jgi:hypothetical protein
MTEQAIRWHSRGVGLDITPGCFVCGATRRNPEANEYMNNVAAIVAKTDEEAALACFDRGARMAYYHSDRAIPQIKIGACDEHLPALNHLAEQWFISQERVDFLTRIYQHRPMVDPR